MKHGSSRFTKKATKLIIPLTVTAAYILIIAKPCITILITCCRRTTRTCWASRNKWSDGAKTLELCHSICAKTPQTLLQQSSVACRWPLRSRPPPKTGVSAPRTLKRRRSVGAETPQTLSQRSSVAPCTCCSCAGGRRRGGPRYGDPTAGGSQRSSLAPCTGSP